MAATDPVTPEPRRFSIRVPRPLWISVAALSLVAISVYIAVRKRGPTGMTLQFTVASKSAADIDVSPDGTQIAVSGVYTQGYANGGFVCDVPSRKITHSFADGAETAAWSPDGARLAVGRGMQIVEYDRNGFTPVRTVAVRQGGVGSLTFDQFGDLFACTDMRGIERFFDSQVFVWWRRDDSIQDDWHEIHALSAGSAYYVSTATVDGRLRIAIVHFPPDGLTVAAVTIDGEHKGDARTEFELPEYGDCWIRLSPSGERLAVLSSTGFRLLDLRADSPSLIHDEPGGPEGEFFCQRQPVDISLDGRRVAYVLRDRVEVRRVQDGSFVSSAPGKFFCVSLSGNGGGLAAIDQKSHSLCFYEISSGGDLP